MSIERLNFESLYSAAEASIHMSRYLCVKEFVKSKDVLDVACGIGYGTRLIKEWGATSVLGLDVSVEAVSQAYQKFRTEGVSFQAGRCEQLPLANQSVDLVCSLETIEHLDEPEKFLKEIKRVIKPNGVVIVSCPNDHQYQKIIDGYSNEFHKNIYKWFEFKELTEKILGPASNWAYGFQLDGFICLPVKDLTFPEKGQEGSYQSMFKAECLSSAYRVNSDQFVNYWNASYYVGFWQKDRTEINSFATMFAKPQEDLISEIAFLKRQIEKLKKR